MPARRRGKKELRGFKGGRNDALSESEIVGFNGIKHARKGGVTDEIKSSAKNNNGGGARRKKERRRRHCSGGPTI